jgi:hypothetical protein
MFCTRLAPHFFCILAALSLLFSTPLHCAEKDKTLLEQIRFEPKSATEEAVTFKLNGPCTPKIFTVKGNTPKIVLDFYDTSTAPSIKGLINSKGKLITAIRTGMHTEKQRKTRVVLDLAPAGEYDFSQNFEAQENTLRITVVRLQRQNGKQHALQEVPEKEGKLKDAAEIPADPPLPMETQEVSPQTAEIKNRMEPASTPPPPIDTERITAVSPSSQPVSIESISFKKNPGKEEKLLFTVNNFQPPIIIGIEEGIPRIICDFPNTAVAEKIPELIETQGQFIQQVRVEKNASQSSIRLILELIPNRHYDLEQIFYKEENLYVLLVKPSGSPHVKNKKQ